MNQKIRWKYDPPSKAAMVQLERIRQLFPFRGGWIQTIDGQQWVGPEQTDEIKQAARHPIFWSQQ